MGKFDHNLRRRDRHMRRARRHLELAMDHLDSAHFYAAETGRTTLANALWSYQEDIRNTAVLIDDQLQGRDHSRRWWQHG